MGLCQVPCYRLSLHQLNSKNDGPGLLFQTIFYRHGNRFLSSVSTNGKAVRGLKLSFDVACVASVSVASVSFPPRQ